MSAEQRFEANHRPGAPAIPVPNLDGVDFDTLTPWQRRIVLAAKGWSSELNVNTGHGSHDKTFGVMMHIKHSAWHGSICDVTLHKATSCARNATALAEAIDGLTRKLLLLAVKVWNDFPESVPCQSIRRLDDGTFETIYVTDKMDTEHFDIYPDSKYGGTVRMPERAYPTEALPGWPGQERMVDYLSLDDTPDTTAKNIAAILNLRKGNSRFSDALGSNPVGGWPMERPWQYEHSVPLYRLGDERYDHKGMRLLDCTTRNLTTFGANQLTKSILETYRHYYERYLKDGARPPGQRDYAETPLPALIGEEDDDEQAATRSPTSIV